MGRKPGDNPRGSNPPCPGREGVRVSKRGGGEAQSTWSWPFPKPSRLSSSVQMEAQGGLSELLLDASLECLILMKKSFICRPVSRRQVWKEFSQVTEALGRVFAGGKCKAVRLARDGLAGVGAEEAEEETECREKNAPPAKRRQNAEVQPKGQSVGLEMCKESFSQKTNSLPREIICSSRKCWGPEDAWEGVGEQRKGGRERRPQWKESESLHV